MIRKAFVMTLKPGCRDEYERRHNPVWPEMREVLKGHGVRNYSIFHERGAEIYVHGEKIPPPKTKWARELNK